MHYQFSLLSGLQFATFTAAKKSLMEMVWQAKFKADISPGQTPVEEPLLTPGIRGKDYLSIPDSKY
jgi:hypothetical protein